MIAKCRRILVQSVLIVTAIGCVGATGYSNQCGPNRPLPPTVTDIQDGKNIACPSDTADLNRIYGALIMYRQNEEIPLMEGTTYEPFDGTAFDFTANDGYEQDDRFFMRTVCDQQYDSPHQMRKNLREGAFAVRNYPPIIREALRALSNQYRTSIPRPYHDEFATSPPNTIVIGLPTWTPPVVDLPEGVTLTSTRAMLKRKAMGNNPNGPTDGSPGQPIDPADNGFKRIRFTDRSGNVNEGTLILPGRNLLLYGAASDVFGEIGRDQVIRSRHYRYYVEVFFTLEHAGLKYFGGVRGNRQLNVHIRRGGNDARPNDEQPVP